MVDSLDNWLKKVRDGTCTFSLQSKLANLVILEAQLCGHQSVLQDVAHRPFWTHRRFPRGQPHMDCLSNDSSQVFLTLPCKSQGFNDV